MVKKFCATTSSAAKILLIDHVVDCAVMVIIKSGKMGFIGLIEVAQLYCLDLEDSGYNIVTN